MYKFPLMPPMASERALSYEVLFWVITLLTVFFTLAVGALILTFVVKYRAGSKASRKNATDHNTMVEIGTSVPMLFLAIGIFGWSANNYINYRKVPPAGKGTEIFVIGKQWMWHLQHMNGIRENNELHIPVNKPVTMTMISQDVLHAMYLPDFRAQFHVVPGRYTRLTFTPTQTGKFKMLCAMHCGTQHSEMVGQVYVLSDKDYAEWLKKGGNRYVDTATTMEEAGRQLFNQKGCVSCHIGKDTERAPTLTGIYNTMRPITDGAPVKADEDYLRDSIVNPYRVLTKGYIATMPSYKGQLTEEQVLQLVTYTKSLTVQSPPDGKMPAYDRPGPVTDPGPGGRTNAADEANKRVSAGNTQFNQADMKR